MKRFIRFSLLLVLAIGLLACGGGDTPTPATPEPAAPTEEAAVAPTATAEPEEEPTATPEPATPTPESNAVSDLQDVQDAVVRIEAQGSFVDPEVGLQLNAAGSGSGFIIDESGLAVTNNHVVTGAALLRVYIGNDEDRAYNARVLGVSECSDLALIDIEGDGFPYLEWYDSDANVGLDVYAAGFPLGDPEFTLTRGIVSKEEADGETEWASVDRVIEHDATINPGNSGGPLITDEGKVVGVNYAGASSTSQYYAIGRDEALEILDQLHERDVTSIGVNGQAIVWGDGNSGIWVASVKSGSPADEAGIQAGDIILSLEGLILATDGTMADYCDILRSRNADDVMNVEVLRFETEEVLEGQLNGRVLEQSFSFAQALEEDVVNDEPTGGAGSDTGGATYTEYTTVTDDSGQLTMEVPAEWSDTNGSAWAVDGESIGVAISAAPSLEEYNNTWSTPGVFFGASGSLNMSDQELLDSIDFTGSCDYGGRESYEDALYTGQYDLWTNCGGEGTVFLVLTAVPEDQSFVAIVQVQVVTDKDLDALDRILNTFVVTGDLQ